MLDGKQVERVAIAIELARGSSTTRPSPVAWRMAIAAIQAMPELSDTIDPLLIEHYQKDWVAKLNKAKTEVD